MTYMFRLPLLKLAFCSLFILFFSPAFSQLGKTVDSIRIIANQHHFKMRDSSEECFHYLGNAVNYFYHFKDARCKYIVIIANKLDVSKMKEYMKIQGYQFQSDNKTVDYMYKNEKEKGEASIEYEGKFVIIKIYEKSPDAPPSLKPDSIPTPEIKN